MLAVFLSAGFGKTLWADFFLKIWGKDSLWYGKNPLDLGAGSPKLIVLFCSVLFFYFDPMIRGETTEHMYVILLWPSCVGIWLPSNDSGGMGCSK